MLDAVSNFAISTCTGFDASTTSITLATGKGALFPTPTGFLNQFPLVVWNSTDYANPSSDPGVEIMRCTGRTGDTLTVVRAQEGTSASAHNTSGKTYSVMLAPTKKLVDDLAAFREFDSAYRDRVLIYFTPWGSNSFPIYQQFQSYGTGGLTSVDSSTDYNAFDIRSGGAAGNFGGFRLVQSDAVRFGSHEHLLEWDAKLYRISNAADNVVVQDGFSDHGAAAATPTDGAIFRYDYTQSANWQGIVYKAGTATAMTAAANVAASTSYQRFRIWVNADASRVEFWVDDTLIGYVAGTTYIPGASNPTAINFLRSQVTATNGNTWNHVRSVRYRCN